MSCVKSKIRKAKGGADENLDHKEQEKVRVLPNRSHLRAG